MPVLRSRRGQVNPSVGALSTQGAENESTNILEKDSNLKMRRQLASAGYLRIFTKFLGIHAPITDMQTPNRSPRDTQTSEVLIDQGVAVNEMSQNPRQGSPPTNDAEASLSHSPRNSQQSLPVASGMTSHMNMQSHPQSRQTVQESSFSATNEAVTSADVHESVPPISQIAETWQEILAYDEKSMRNLGRDRFLIQQLEVPLEAKSRFESIKSLFDADLARLIAGRSPGNGILLYDQLCMIGTKKGDYLTVKPTILISCGSLKCKRIIKSSLLRIQPHYLVGLGIPWIVRYDKSVPVLAALSEEESVGEVNRNHPNVLQGVETISVERYPKTTSSGMKLTIVARDSDGVQKRYATLGGIVKIGRVHYGMTTAHSLNIDRPHRVEEDSDEELHSGEMSDPSDEDDVELREVLPLSQTSTSDQHQPHANSDITLWSSMLPDQRIACSLYGQTQSTLGVVTVDDAISDWAVFDVPDQHVLQNSYSLRLEESEVSLPRIYVTDIATPFQMCPGIVRVLCGTRMSRAGHLSMNIVSLHNGRWVLDVQQIFLDEPLVAGASGSWVARGNFLVGMVVAISDGGFCCYMLPMWKVIESIGSTFGQEARLVARQPLHEDTSNKSARSQGDQEVTSIFDSLIPNRHPLAVKSEDQARGVQVEIKKIEEELFQNARYREGDRVDYRTPEGRLLIGTVRAKKINAAAGISYQIQNVQGALHDNGKWVNEAFLRLVRRRGSEVSNYKSQGSAASTYKSQSSEESTYKSQDSEGSNYTTATRLSVKGYH